MPGWSGNSRAVAPRRRAGLRRARRIRSIAGKQSRASQRQEPRLFVRARNVCAADPELRRNQRERRLAAQLQSLVGEVIEVDQLRLDEDATQAARLDGHELPGERGVLSQDG